MLFDNINKGVQEYKNTDGAVLIDVREADEFAAGHIPGAQSIPLSRIKGIDYDLDTPLFLYCLVGSRSMRAASALKQMGYEKVKSIGGINRYKGDLDYSAPKR